MTIIVKDENFVVDIFLKGNLFNFCLFINILFYLDEMDGYIIRKSRTLLSLKVV